MIASTCCFDCVQKPGESERRLKNLISLTFDVELYIAGMSQQGSPALLILPMTTIRGASIRRS